MSQNRPVLHLVCGKAASGKTRLTAELSKAAHTVLIAEDAWLAALFGDELETLADYVRCARRLRRIMKPHVEALLRADLSVVLDFPANTLETRQWMRGIIDAAQADHRLHVLDVPDEVCRARLRARNEAGNHSFALSEAQFDALSRHFVAPSREEGFTLVRHELE